MLNSISMQGRLANICLISLTACVFFLAIVFFAARVYTQADAPAAESESIEEEIVEQEPGEKEGEQEPDDHKWEEFVSEDGRFEIMMSGVPQYQHHVRETRVGEIEENIYELTTDEGDFIVEYTDLPAIAVIFGGKRAILRKVKSALLKNEKGEELDYVRIKYKKLRGAELEYVTKEEIGRARLFLVKKRLYVLVVKVKKEKGDESVMDEYLNSFKVFKKRRQHKPHKYIDMKQTSPD